MSFRFIYMQIHTGKVGECMYKHVSACLLKCSPIIPFNTIYIESTYYKHRETYLWHRSHFCQGCAHHMIQSLVELLMLYIKSSTHHCHCKVIIILNDRKSLDVTESAPRTQLLGLKGKIKNIVWLFAKTFPCGKGLDDLRTSGLHLNTERLIMACLLVERGEVLPQNLST